MDITDTTPMRMAAGIDDLCQGKGLIYESVHFWRETTTQPAVLHVTSYSEYIHLENVTPTEAAKQIARSREVAADLAKKNSQFAEMWEKDRKSFHFCYDYGMGGVEVAEEIDGQMKWKN
jgi:hypothetical protein